MVGRSGQGDTLLHGVVTGLGWVLSANIGCSVFSVFTEVSNKSFSPFSKVDSSSFTGIPRPRREVSVLSPLQIIQGRSIFIKRRLDDNV